MGSRRAIRVCVLACAAVASACATSDWHDWDTWMDAWPDTSMDTGGDVEQDTGDDTAVDVPSDTDAEGDTAPDTAIDTSVDTAVDTSVDTAVDTGSDTSADVDAEPDPCGNGLPDAGEECDDGTNSGAYGTCNPDCTLAPRCGDGTTDSGYEACDDAGASATCSATCQRYTSEAGMCGDSIDNDMDGTVDCADGDCSGTIGCSGGSILVLYEECSGIDHITPAIANLGLTSVTTFTYDPTSFYTQLLSGTWDIVVVDEYANLLAAGTMDALYSHVLAGGKLIFSYWYLMYDGYSHSLVTHAGVSPSMDYSLPLPVYSWSSTSMFTTPGAVPNLTTMTDGCGTDGQYASVTTATAAAGYTMADAAGQVAISVSSDGRVIMNLFTPQTVSQDADFDGRQDMMELYENQISMLL